MDAARTAWSPAALTAWSPAALATGILTLAEPGDTVDNCHMIVVGRLFQTIYCNIEQIYQK